MDARMRAAAEGKVVEVKGLLAQDRHTSGEVDGGVTPSQATDSSSAPPPKARESWKD